MDNEKIEVQIVETIDANYIIQNKDGLKTKIHKSIVTDNDIPIIDGKIKISLAIYTHYFGPIKKEIKKQEDEEDFGIFKKHLKLIIESTSIITANPDFYHYHSNRFYLGNYLSGITHLPLGCLLNLWKQKRMVRTCSQCNGQIYVYGAGGSILSGFYFWHGICIQCNEYKHGEGGKEKLCEMYLANSKELKKHPEKGKPKRLGEIIAYLLAEGKERK